MKRIHNYFASLIIIWIFNTEISAQISLTGNKTDSLSQKSEKEWNVYLKGFVQFDAMIDFQDMEMKEGFAASSIINPQLNRTSSFFSVKQSQLGLKIQQQSEENLSAYIELDFFGPNGTTAPRFRQGYITWRKWAIGQMWSNFSDIEIFPNIFDFVGPDGLMSSRRIQLRYSTPLSKNEDLSVSLEDPNIPSISLPENSLDWKERSIYPSLTAKYSYAWEKSYMKIGGIFTPITYDMRKAVHEPYKMNMIMGIGAMVSGKVHVNKLNNIRIQSSYGKGITTNNVDLIGEKYDAIPNPQNENILEPLNMFNLVGIYEHWWTPKLSSVLSYSFSQVGRKTFIPEHMIRNFKTVEVNLVYQPYKKVRCGVEGHYGNIRNFGNETSDAFRIQFSTSLSF